MTPCAALAGLVLLGASAGATDARRRVDVQVVEVASGRAYLSPGSESLVQVGDVVSIGGADYPVLAQNGKNIVVALGKRQLEPGQRGSVTVRVAEAKTWKTRAAPRPLRAFTDQWRPPRLPAESQSPRFVPLGVMSDARRSRAAFMLDYQRIQPLSGPASAIGRTRLRAVLHTELSHLPLTFDADGFLEIWQAQDLGQRPQSASRPLLTVRQLELGYQGEVVHGAVGRLRYASSTVGMLDGARVSAALSEAWAVGAFGGALADPLDAGLSTDAARFGADVSWQNDEVAARPRASLTFQGSRFQGRTDERRVTGLFESYPDFGRLGAHAEVSFFDGNNPWAAATTELTAAGADAALTLGSLRLGAAVDMRRPERSLWLAAFLPAGYFCVTRAVPGRVNEPCIGGDQRYAALLNAAWEAGAWRLDAGTTFTTTRRATADQTTAFLNFQRRDIFGALRLDAGSSVSRGTLIDSGALDVGVGAPFGDDAADLSLYYRPSLVRYRADYAAFLEHGVGSRFWWAPTAALDLSGSLEFVTGRDLDVLFLQIGAAWRPRF